MINVLEPKETGTEWKVLKEVFESHWIGMGPKVKELEEKWAKYTGAKYAVATNSCTSALDIACRLIKLPNPVTVSAFTFISSALAPLNAGYKVKFVDIDDSLCTPKADIQVMYGGRQYGEGIIYDMAHSGGAKHKGILSCWSFHAVKNLPAGDGGMITMNDKKLYERAKALSWCGIDKSTWQRSGKKYSWDYDIQEVGLKAHMNDLTAVIALEQLKVLGKGNDYRKYLASLYDKHLAKWIPRPQSETWHLYTIRVPERDELFDYLAEHGIGCGVHYKPLTHYKIFGKQDKLPITEKAFEEIITLPLHLNLTTQDIINISDKINGFYSERYGF